jgi:hypothetical protein
MLSVPGTRKSQPCTETTSFAANPWMLSGLKLVKAVPEVVWTAKVKGAKVGLAEAAGGTKKFGKVAKVKFKSAVSTVPTVPVI